MPALGPLEMVLYPDMIPDPWDAPPTQRQIDWADAWLVANGLGHLVPDRTTTPA